VKELLWVAGHRELGLFLLDLLQVFFYMPADRLLLGILRQLFGCDGSLWSLEYGEEKYNTRSNRERAAYSLVDRLQVRLIKRADFVQYLLGYDLWGVLLFFLSSFLKRVSETIR
jgi:hypothetical protein